MPTVNIHTTLGSNFNCNKKEYIIIKRGATAIINYNLFIKNLTIDDLEQVIFLFKQDKTITSYELFEYDGDEKYINSHFRYNEEEAKISFIFAPEETKDLIPSDPGNKNSLMNFEVVLNLDTDKCEQLGRLDSTIIEQQAPICIIDTIYAHTEII